MEKQPKRLNQEDILAWADGLAGVAVKETAAKQGVSAQSIWARKKKVAEFIAEKFDINDYRLPLYTIYPEAIRSLLHNLKKNDVTTTLALLRGLQVLVDKKEVDQGLRGQTDAELAALIGQAVGSEPKPEEPGTESGTGADTETA